MSPDQVSSRLALLCGAFLLIACQPVVDTSGLDPITGYEQWYRVDATGPIPGHGDSYRIIHANATAQSFGHAGHYPPGSVLVKEIRDIGGDGQPGDLRYIAVMRKLEEAPPGGELQGGWQFTMLGQLGDDETQGFTCWHRCHVQGPIDGAWLDYGL